MTIDLVFDGVGHGVFGRVAQGMTVRYAGRRTGDDVILDLTSEAAMQAGSGPTGATHVLAVTNDRELRERLHVKGARTVPIQWLLNRLDLPVIASASPGNQQAPVGIGSPGSSPNPGNSGGERRSPGLEARPRRDDEDGSGAQGRPPQAAPSARRAALTARGVRQPGPRARMRA